MKRLVFWMLLALSLFLFLGSVSAEDAQEIRLTIAANEEVNLLLAEKDGLKIYLNKVQLSGDGKMTIVLAADNQDDHPHFLSIPRAEVEGQVMFEEDLVVRTLYPEAEGYRSAAEAFDNPEMKDVMFQFSVGDFLFGAHDDFLGLQSVYLTFDGDVLKAADQMAVEIPVDFAQNAILTEDGTFVLIEKDTVKLILTSFFVDTGNDYKVCFLNVYSEGDPGEFELSLQYLMINGIEMDRFSFYPGGNDLGLVADGEAPAIKEAESVVFALQFTYNGETSTEGPFKLIPGGES